MTTTLLTLLGLGLSVAVAQDELAAEAPESTPELARLEAELVAARAQTAEADADRARLDALITAAATLTDRSTTELDKLAAVGTLAELADARAVPFLKLAADREGVAVKRALLAAAPVFSDDVRMHRMVVFLTTPSQAEIVRIDAIKALDTASVPDAPQLLMALAGSRTEPESIKAAALAQLQANHADFLAAQGGVRQEVAPVDGSALLLFSGTSGVVGGLLLASVGELGQSDAGTGIGALGGGLIGGGLGLVYARSNNISLDDALQYTTATSAGLVYGGQVAFLVDASTPLYLLTVGGTAGAGVGLAAMSALDPSRADNAETVAAMAQGNQTLSGAARWGDLWYTGGVGLGMVGQSIGAGLGLALRDDMDFDSDDGTLIVSAGMVGGWLSFVVPLAADVEINAGATQTAIPLSMIAAGAVSQVRPVPVQQTLTADYGFAAGNLLGAGLPLLLVADPDGTLVAQGVFVGGMAGIVAGATVHDRLDFSAGDAVFTAVGTGLLTAEASALSFVLSEKIGFDREGGLILSTAGGGMAGLGLASQFLDVEPAEPLLVASAAGWGVFYGGLVPVALGLEGEAADLVLGVTITSDVFMGLAALSQTDGIDLDPRATVLPQLGGVGGAVLGSLGSGLFVADGQAISAGALVGSVAGVGVGIALERRYGSEWIPRASRLPDVRLVSTPVVIDRSESGMALGFAVEGW